MKYYFKVFLISFLCFSTLIGSALIAFKGFRPAPNATMPEYDLVDEEDQVGQDPEQNLVERVNILVFGTDGVRADTILVLSYEVSAQSIDIISIPRDTYHHVPGHNNKDQKKINAVYGFGKGDGGSPGMKQQIANLLNMPMHYFVKVDYNGVSDIIDVIGGVEVDVHRNLYYDDPKATPPLHIHISKGVQVLDGKNSVGYLRWRKTMTVPEKNEETSVELQDSKHF